MMFPSLLLVSIAVEVSGTSPALSRAESSLSIYEILRALRLHLPPSRIFIAIRPDFMEVRCDAPPEDILYDPVVCLREERDYSYHEYRLQSFTSPFYLTMRREFKHQAEGIEVGAGVSFTGWGRPRTRVLTTDASPNRQDLYVSVDTVWRQHIAHHSADVLMIHPAVWNCRAIGDLFHGGGIRPKIVTLGVNPDREAVPDFGAKRGNLTEDDIETFRSLQCGTGPTKRLFAKIKPQYVLYSVQGFWQTYLRKDVLDLLQLPPYPAFLPRSRVCQWEHQHLRGQGNDEVVTPYAYVQGAEDCKRLCEERKDCSWWSWDATSQYGPLNCWVWTGGKPLRVDFQFGWVSGNCTNA